MMKPCTLCHRIGRLCVWPYRVLMSLFNLLFLPESLRQWVFGTGTRGLELLNALFLLGWAAVLLTDAGNVYLLLPDYTKFAEMPHWLSFALFAGVGFALLAFLPSESPRSNLLSGFFLVAAALLWVLVSVGFWYAYPPLTTAMIVYPVLALMSWWVGVMLVDNAKDELGKARGG